MKYIRVEDDTATVRRHTDDSARTMTDLAVSAAAMRRSVCTFSRI